VVRARDFSSRARVKRVSLLCSCPPGQALGWIASLLFNESFGHGTPVRPNYYSCGRGMGALAMVDPRVQYLCICSGMLGK